MWMGIGESSRHEIALVAYVINFPIFNFSFSYLISYQDSARKLDGVIVSDVITPRGMDIALSVSVSAPFATPQCRSMAVC